jgi:hypothetical protein
MNRLVTTILLGVVCICILPGCSNYVYAPAALLPEKALNKGEVDLKAGVGSLPKVRPQTPYTTECAIADIGYGFSNRFNLYASAWTDLTTDPFFAKAGISLAARTQLWQGEKLQLLLYPKVALLKNKDNFDAWGVSIPLIVMIPVSTHFYTYVGAGGAYGNRRLNENAFKDEELFAAIGHVAVGYNCTENFRILLEANPIWQYNAHYEKQYFICSPTLSIGYTFRKTAYYKTKFNQTRQKRE